MEWSFKLFLDQSPRKVYGRAGARTRPLDLQSDALPASSECFRKTKKKKQKKKKKIRRLAVAPHSHFMTALVRSRYSENAIFCKNTPCSMSEPGFMREKHYIMKGKVLQTSY